MLYINGTWRQAQSGETLTVYNPATGKELAEVASGGRIETKEAIDAANEAFTHWKNTTGLERSTLLRKTAELIRENGEDIAQTITKEMGKSITEARREIISGANYVEWFAEEAKRIYGETIPAPQKDKHLMLMNEPIGVAAAITPWNFPLSMITRKITPALAAGCTVILKPAPNTPLTAIKLFECLDKSGFPAGVANLVIGPAEEIGKEFTTNPIVRKLAFTGSTNIGKKLMKDSAATVKKVSMELGGHAPFVVFEDADIDEAVAGAISTKFVNSGQTCICTNRIYVADEIADEFSTKFAQKANKLKVGNGLEEETKIGPLVNAQALEKVSRHVEDAKKHGGNVLCGGETLDLPGMNGFFYKPTVINEATEDMQIATEETFGPVVPIFSFQTEDEVISKANDTNYGLAAYCYTKDLSRGLRMTRQLEYGIVGINDPAPIAVQSPFGGVKESGIGKEGGRQGMEEYLEKKFISIKY
ncbi:NAD-dependent succinate-semialdehyde dehydrogenase [Alteribacillus sp. YIM 98480]|uniref:NAD-dependent succinate-semialdehyde dehydrogenase n=1 Tax=Alteribacillus sp. YIM 98480 TaxID=2606599 RepID=UPI00131EAB1E|nr:NAD-dependent succinate-semialdehyde dehydrogenase [Alteribacillus sp. YIM 98480]